MPRRAQGTLLQFLRAGWRVVQNDDPDVSLGNVEICVNGKTHRMTAIEFWEKVVIEVDIKLKKRRKGYNKLPKLPTLLPDDQSSSSGANSLNKIRGSYLHHIIVGQYEWFRQQNFPSKNKLIQILLHNVDFVNIDSQFLQMKFICALKTSPSGAVVPTKEPKPETISINETIVAQIESQPSFIEPQIESQATPIEPQTESQPSSIEQTQHNVDISQEPKVTDMPPSAEGNDPQQNLNEDAQFPDTPSTSNLTTASEERPISTTDFSPEAILEKNNIEKAQKQAKIIPHARSNRQRKTRRERKQAVGQKPMEESTESEEARNRRARTRRVGQRSRQRYHEQHRYSSTYFHIQTQVDSWSYSATNLPVEWTPCYSLPVYGECPPPNYTTELTTYNQLTYSNQPYYFYPAQQIPVQNIYYPSYDPQYFPQSPVFPQQFVYVPPASLMPPYHTTVEFLPYPVPLYPQPIVHPVVLPQPEFLPSPVQTYIQYPEQNIEPSLQYTREDNDSMEMSYHRAEHDYDQPALKPEPSLETPIENTFESNTLVVEQQFQTLTVSEETDHKSEEKKTKDGELPNETQSADNKTGRRERKEGSTSTGSNIRHEEERRVTIDASEAALLNNLKDHTKTITLKESIPDSELLKMGQFIFEKWGTIPRICAISNTSSLEFVPRQIRQLSSIDRPTDASTSTTYTAHDQSTTYYARDQSTTYTARDQSTTYNAHDQSTTYNAHDQSTTYNAHDQSTTYNARDQSTTYTDRDQSTTYTARDQSTTYTASDQSTNYTARDQSMNYNARDQSMTYTARDQATQVENDEEEIVEVEEREQETQTDEVIKPPTTYADILRKRKN